MNNSNFYKDQTFTLTTDDFQTVTYTITKVCDDGRLLVRSSLLERAYFLSQEAFEDFLRVVGYPLEEKPTINLAEEYQQATEQYILAQREGTYP